MKYMISLKFLSQKKYETLSKRERKQGKNNEVMSLMAEEVRNNTEKESNVGLFGWLLLPCFLRWVCGCLLMCCLVGMLEWEGC
jgi:hypothetical protein